MEGAREGGGGLDNLILEVVRGGGTEEIKKRGRWRKKKMQLSSVALLQDFMGPQLVHILFGYTGDTK